MNNEREEEKPKKLTWRRRIVGFLVVVLLVVLFRPVAHVWMSISGDESELIPPAEGHVDDASRLNETSVQEVWPIPADAREAEAQIAALLTRARTHGWKVSIAGARHSMGGHTIYPGGVVIDMLPFRQLELDEERNILRVQAGALWRDIIAFLDLRGRSVAVMQSNNSFSVGGSISVNCHGWQFGRGPIASTVESFRIMKADGTIARCSREENRELFGLALGGYGLFGVILDAELRVVPNQRYRLEQHVVSAVEALSVFDSEVKDQPGVQMVYARMNVAPANFLNEAVLNAYFVEEGEIPPLQEPGLVTIRRAIFRGSAGGDYGKEFRWSAETKIQPWLRSDAVSRNGLLNESAEVFQNRSWLTTDILHEYFIPRRRLAGFVEDLREIIPRHQADLLNVTVRSVDQDNDTVLRYATEPVIALVMLFVQQRDQAGEKRMEELTRELIDSALKHEGRYYLPYRLHASREQFLKAYPMAPQFFAKKREHDPGELFQNSFYLKYGKSGATHSADAASGSRSSN